jgi:GcrA cell cycle regulator
MVEWTNERVDLLRTYAKEGLSCSRIAALIGGGASRNAVIGKINRLGLAKPRVQPTSSVTHLQKRRRSKKSDDQVFVTVRKLVRDNNLGGFKVVDAIEPDQPESCLDAADIPFEQRKQFFDLEPHHCRFPYGEVGKSDFFFCGAPDADWPARPYCRVHARIASGGLPRAPGRAPWIAPRGQAA